MTTLPATLAAAACLCWAVSMFYWWRSKLARIKLHKKLSINQQSKKKQTRMKDDMKRRVIYLAHRFAPLGKRFPFFMNKNDIQRKLELAGFPENLDLDSFYGLRFVSFIGFSFGAVLLQTLGFINGILQLLIMIFGLFAPTVWIKLAAAARQEQISVDLPEFMDMMSVTLQAGIPLEPAMKQIVNGMEGPLAEELNRFIQELDMGVSREEAFTRLMKRNNSPELEMLVTALLQGSKLGVPIANTFRNLSEDIRNTRINRMKEKAAKAGPKVTLITTFFILPGVLLLIIGLLILNFIYNPEGMGVSGGFGL